jgi:hypothetical protein
LPAKGNLRALPLWNWPFIIGRSAHFHRNSYDLIKKNGNNPLLRDIDAIFGQIIARQR